MMTHVSSNENDHDKMNIISEDWILLDSGSTISSLKNRNLLRDIRTIPDPLRVYTNGGHKDYSQVGMMKIMPFEVYLSETSLANILSLADVSDHFRVTMDSDRDHSLHVHISEQSILRFRRCGSGLYYLDTKSYDNNNDTVINYPISFVQTVAANKEYFS